MKNSHQFTHLLVRNRIKDSKIWLAGFRAHRPQRIAAGLQERLILKNVNPIDSNEECFVIFDTLDPVKTAEFIESASLREFKSSLGLVAEPEYSYLTALDDFKLPLKTDNSDILKRVHSAFERVDTMDSAGFAEAFGFDSVFQFGNLPAVRGRENIQNFVDYFFTQLKSISHKIESSHCDDLSVSIRGVVSYIRKDGTQLDLAFSNFISSTDGHQFSLWQIYMDPSPLHEGVSKE
ncbi:MAG: hypothetical protein H7222_15700 [Methylotenera sp.]|nr:hypothetical protein [Oligoflexia bacterium]